MAKKRGKPGKSSKKSIRKAKTLKKTPNASGLHSKRTRPQLSEKTPEAQKPLKDNLYELEILSEEEKVEHKVDDIEKKEEAIEKEEAAIAGEEKKLEKETVKVEGLERKIVRDVEPKPLRGFTAKDLKKGIIGAFIGVIAHFGFIYGKAIAQYISVPRATLLIVFSYLLIIVLMYETGYREIKEKRLLGILPKRATIIYVTSLVVVVIIFFLFNLIDLADPVGLYKEIAVTSVLASVGAGTADLIGRH